MIAYAIATTIRIGIDFIGLLCNRCIYIASLSIIHRASLAFIAVYHLDTSTQLLAEPILPRYCKASQFLILLAKSRTPPLMRLAT